MLAKNVETPYISIDLASIDFVGGVELQIR
jgi:hypothetical protein